MCAVACYGISHPQFVEVLLCIMAGRATAGAGSEAAAAAKHGRGYAGDSRYQTVGCVVALGFGAMSPCGTGMWAQWLPMTTS
jgi:hypothetical protein